MDRISGLPDEILCHTLSFLSTKQAALTSVLSKRWRNLFALSPNLRLEDEESLDEDQGLSNSRSFSDFVDRVLALSSNIPTTKFSVKCHRQVIESAHINLWLSNLLNRGGALDLLDLDVVVLGVTSLPLEVFTCRTLVKLKLGKGFGIHMVPDSASLRSLKTLSLDCIRFFNHAFEALVAVCPVLEELVIRGEQWEHWNWCTTVSCPTLQRLKIDCEGSMGFVGSDFRSISFDTPRLAHLDYYGFVPNEFPIVNLDSLVEAKLALRERMIPNESNPSNLIKGLKNVAILNLSTLETVEMFCSRGDTIPVLENLSRLSIKINYGFWKFLPLLLKKTPNVETLVIEGPSRRCRNGYGVHECLSGYSFLSSCPVKVIEITKFWGTIGEFAQLKHLLEKLPSLELLKVCASGKNETAKLQVATDLLMLPRACKIELDFFTSNSAKA